MASAGRTSTRGLGAGERPQLLGPPQRRQPPQPPGRRRVGDHPQQQREDERRAGDPGRHAPRRRDLAGHRADTDEHRQRRHERDREEGRARRPRHVPTGIAGQQREPEAIGADATAASAARNASPRPTAPARTSSWRPDSSSARSARTAPKSAHSPAKIRQAPSRHDSQPPVVTQVVRARRRAAAGRPVRPEGARELPRARRASGRRCGRPRACPLEAKANSTANEIVRTRESRSARRKSGAQPGTPPSAPS